MCEARKISAAAQKSHVSNAFVPSATQGAGLAARNFAVSAGTRDGLAQIDEPAFAHRREARGLCGPPEAPRFTRGPAEGSALGPSPAGGRRRSAATPLGPPVLRSAARVGPAGFAGGGFLRRGPAKFAVGPRSGAALPHCRYDRALAYLAPGSGAPSTLGEPGYRTNATRTRNMRHGPPADAVSKAHDVGGLTVPRAEHTWLSSSASRGAREDHLPSLRARNHQPGTKSAARVARTT